MCAFFKNYLATNELMENEGIFGGYDNAACKFSRRNKGELGSRKGGNWFCPKILPSIVRFFAPVVTSNVFHAVFL